MSRRHPEPLWTARPGAVKWEAHRERWFSPVEEAELRRLVYRAFALRRTGDPDEYRKALQALEDWEVETVPERLRRNAS